MGRGRTAILEESHFSGTKIGANVCVVHFQEHPLKSMGAKMPEYTIKKDFYLNVGQIT